MINASDSIVIGMLDAGKLSIALSKERISNVCQSLIVDGVETIEFLFDDKRHIGFQRGRNRDACVGFSDDADKALALRIMIDGDALTA